MKKLFSIVLLFGISSFFPEKLCAQNLATDTVQFQTAGYTDLNDSTLTAVTAESQFVCYGSHHIRWIQEGGAVVYIMEIINSSGTSLPDILGETVTKDVTIDGGITGSFEVTKIESGTSIVLTLNGGTSPIHVQFAVTSIDTL